MSSAKVRTEVGLQKSQMVKEEDGWCEDDRVRRMDEESGLNTEEQKH